MVRSLSFPSVKAMPPLLAALGITMPSYMNGWQYARNCVLTLSAISCFNVIAGCVCVWDISIWWIVPFILIWDIWRRNIVLKENCEISPTIYDVWLYDYLVIYDLFAWAVCLSSTSIHYRPTGSQGDQVIPFLLLAAVWYCKLICCHFQVH